MSSSLLFINVAVVGAFDLLQDNHLQRIESDLYLEVSPSEMAIKYPELSSFLTDDRIDSVYKDFLVAYRDVGSIESNMWATKRGLINIQNEMVITLGIDSTEISIIKKELEIQGIKITASSGNVMDIAIPFELIEESMDSEEQAGILDKIAGLEHVQFIRFPAPSKGDIGFYPVSIPNLTFMDLLLPLKIGDVESESLSMIGALNWQNQGYSGTGIRIGILDKGFNKYKELLGTDLPSNIVGKSFYYPYDLDNGITEHGTAVAEIVHDIAPDSELFFASYGTETEMEQAVDWLLVQGVDIIQNSTGSIKGPFNGTSPKARMVDQVVESGVLWVNAIGNAAEGHYRGKFSDADGNGFHEFVSDKDLMPFVIPVGEGMIFLNWDDYEQGDQDFDLYIFDADQNKIASSRNIQDGPGSSPVEGILYDFPDNGPYYAAFYASNATRSVVFDFFVWDGVVKLSSAEHSLLVPSDARRSLTVGGVYWKDDVLEDYSSRGPTQDGRLKPELVAPTRVTSVAFGKAWTGTSASAPHVSGASALIMQAFPDFEPDQVVEFLEARALDLGAAGPDNSYGYGRLWLGNGPESSEAPLPTGEIPVPGPVETLIQPSLEEITPTGWQTATPSLNETEEGSKFPLVLIACVIIPGFLGLLGIGLLGLVIYQIRMKSESRLPYASPVPAPIPPQIMYPEPRICPIVEEGDICQRCGSSFRPQARFCSVCGSPLVSFKTLFKRSCLL